MGPFRIRVYNNFQDESQTFGFIRKVDAAKGNSPMRAKHERNRADVLLQALGCFLEPRFWPAAHGCLSIVLVRERSRVLFQQSYTGGFSRCVLCGDSSRSLWFLSHIA